MPSPTAFTSTQPGDPAGDRFQILCLDGGGVGSLLVADVLAHLEAQQGTPVADHFDLIAGTSVGGLIALALGAGLAAAEISSRYPELLTKLRAARHRQRNLISRSTHRETDLVALQDLLKGVLGEKTLGDSSKRLLVPARDPLSGKVRLFRTPHDRSVAHQASTPMVDVALAAMNEVRQIWEHGEGADSEHRQRSGVENPAGFAIGEVRNTLGVPLESMHVLSVGVTFLGGALENRLEGDSATKTSTSAADGPASEMNTVDALATALISTRNVYRVNGLASSNFLQEVALPVERRSPFEPLMARSFESRPLEVLFQHSPSEYSPVRG